MYYRNGKPKFEYNYNNEKINVYDKNGIRVEEIKDDHSFNLNIMQ